MTWGFDQEECIGKEMGGWVFNPDLKITKYLGRDKR
jgi:hypothetical protein